MKKKPFFQLSLFVILLVSCSSDELEGRLTGTWVMTRIECLQLAGDSVDDLIDYSQYGTYQFKGDGTLLVKSSSLEGFFPNGTYSWELRKENETSAQPVVETLYIESTGFFQTEIGSSEMVLSNQAVDGCRYEFRKISAF